MMLFYRIAWVFVLFLGPLIHPAGARSEQDLEGLIEPAELLQVSSQVPGILEEVAVERGDRVEKDQVIARLKSSVERAQVELARARVEFGRRKTVRNEELYQKQLISIHDKDEMETELLISELQLQEAAARLDLRTIRSPVQGVVVEPFKGKGEYIGEGPILSIARIDPLNVEVIVPVARLGEIKKDMKAQVRPFPPVAGVFAARVVLVDQVIDAASGTFGVRLELPNPDHRLPAGLRCKVRFLGR